MDARTQQKSIQHRFLHGAWNVKLEPAFVFHETANLYRLVEKHLSHNVQPHSHYHMDASMMYGKHGLMRRCFSGEARYLLTHHTLLWKYRWFLISSICLHWKLKIPSIFTPLHFSVAKLWKIGYYFGILLVPFRYNEKSVKEIFGERIWEKTLGNFPWTYRKKKVKQNRRKVKGNFFGRFWLI